MKKRRLSKFSFVLSLVLVVGLIGAKPNAVEQPEILKNKTELKQFTVSEKKLDAIAMAAKRDGGEAAEMVNKLKGNDFEAAVNRVLTECYENGETQHLDEFENNVGKEAAEIIKGYEEAAEERKNADALPYEAGVSLLSFGADVTEEEIKNIVKDQYGECEYIHKCPDGTYMVKVKNSLGLTVDKAVDTYGEYAETISTDSNDRLKPIVQANELVNDYFAKDQYYLNNMRAADAWQFIRGRSHSKVKVAIIDGGADLNCVDLRESSSSLSAEILSNGSIIPLSQSSQQYINDHGTYVAGIIGATANNGTQIAGVASCINNDVVELINIKIELYVDKIAMGIDYALQCNAKVVNISLGSARDQNDMERAAIDRFVAAGGTIVCGAGNDGNDAAYYPSDYSNTIGVVSVDSGYTIAENSNRGWNKDICAPGVSIFVPGAGDTTWIANGTSLASPMVAGVVAMMYSVNPGLNTEQVRNIIRSTAMDLGDAGRDYTYAYGFINAYDAVVSAAGGTTEPATTTTGAQTTDGPQEVFGHVISSGGNNHINVVWGSNVAMEQLGQKYNVYIDGVKRLSDVGCASYDFYDISAGTHTVKITAVYNGKESLGVTGEVVVNGESATTTTAATTTMPGYIKAGENWTDLNYWSVYFASGWGGNPTGSYKNGNSYNDFGIYVDTYSGAEWAIQLKTKVLNATIGTTYICKVSAMFNSNMTDTIIFKDEGTQVSKTYTLINGKNNFEIEFTPTADNTQIFFGLGKLPAGGNFVITSFSLEEKEQPTEPTTEEPTTVEETTTVEVTTEEETTTEEPTTEVETTKKTIEGGIEINGYQISATAKGMRTVYSVDSEIDGKDVVSSGVVYSLADYAEASELYVGSSSEYVKSYESTSAGVSGVLFSDSDIATSYAMTMLFATKAPAEYNANWRICAYAKLSDGTYVYTDAITYTIYAVADELYQKCEMTTKERHDYLYTDILSIVNKEYEVKEYEWSNTYVGA